METKEIIERLRNMVEITIDADFRNILAAAAQRLEERDRASITMTVTVPEQRLKDIVDEAFRNVTDKDFDYVVEAVKEKMEREGKAYVEEKEAT